MAPSGKRGRSAAWQTPCHEFRQASCVEAPRWRRLVASVNSKIEGEDAIHSDRPLQYLGMPQRAHRIVVAGAPMLLHCAPREFKVLRRSFVIAGVIDQLDQVVDFLVGLGG